jgi:uncharacterized lipoprotein YmbA
MMVAAMAMVTTLALAACGSPQATPTVAPTVVPPAPTAAPEEAGRPLFIDFYAPW